MTHEHSWPTKIGPGAEHVGVSTLSPHWNTICEVLLAHGIPHTILSRTLPKPPTLEGWSFSVYNGAEEHASGWGSTTLADMAPALLAAVGMSDATTANKRAQAAENLAQSLAGDRDGAVEALDIANNTIGKLCAVMAGAGFTGDLLTGVQRLITQRDALADGCRDFVAKAVGAEETIAELREERKDLSAILKRWEDFVRGYLPTVTLATNTADRHFDLRVALGDEVIYALKRELSHSQSVSDAAKRELTEAQAQLRDISDVLGPRRGDESAYVQAERTRKILDCWHTLALKHLPDCPQLRRAGHGNAGFDLGTLHFELRGFIGGELSALRERLATCAEREDIIAALGRPCSTNTIATEVEHLTSEVRRYRHSADSLAAENAHLRSSLAAADSVVRLVTAALETPEGTLVTERATAVLKESKSAAMWEAEARKAWAYGDQIDRVLPKGGPTDGLLERAVTLAGEVTFLRDMLDARATTDPLVLTKPLRLALGWAERTDLNPERVVEAAAVALTHSVALSKEVTRLNRALENTGGYGARDAAKALRKENESLRNQVTTLTAAVDGDLARSARVLAVVRTALETPEGMGLAGHAAKVLRRAKAADAAITNLRTEVAKWKSFALMQDADGHEAATLRKRLDQWVAWGCRAACVINADDDSLRMLIDRALPMWRRGSPQG